MRFIIALSAAILSTASVADAATVRGFDPMAAGRFFEGRSVFVNHASPMAPLSWPPLSPIGSDGAGPGGVCGRTRHRLAGHCVSTLMGHPSQPETYRMTLLVPPLLGHGAKTPA